MRRYEGRVVIVTGAARGLGRAMAERFAAEGASLALCDVVPDVEHITGEALGAGGQAVTGMTVDVTDPDAVHGFVDRVMADQGRIDVLVNNAAVAADGRVEQLGADGWGRVVDVALNGGFHCTAAVVPHMREAGYGRILSVSSMCRNGCFGAANYSAAKAGLVGLTRTVALETARHGITANVVAPGPFEAPMLGQIPRAAADRLVGMVPMRRPGRPEELADAAAFLCAEQAGFITGAVLAVDGGAGLLGGAG